MATTFNIQTTTFTVQPTPGSVEALAVPVGADLDLAAAVSALGGHDLAQGAVAAVLGERGGRGVLDALGFRGEVGDTATLAVDGRIVIAVGVAPAGDRKASPTRPLSADEVRRAAAALGRAASHVGSLATTLHLAGADREASAGAVVEGIALVGYRYRSAAEDGAGLASVTLVDGDAAPIASALAAAEVGVRATLCARRWVDHPGGQLTPPAFADLAADAGEEAGLEVEVWDEERIRAESLGCLAGVAAGSAEPPRLVRVTYDPPERRGHLALVGKGITFDSGGLSLKPPKSMETMKADMGGAAAVLAAVLACPELAPALRVDAWMAVAENMPGGRATRPGDVLRARNGTTVEVVNTDAEGRLVLADALVVAGEAGPDVIVDVATLTGGQRVALGPQLAAVLGTDDAVSAVTAAGARAGEPAWRLPLWEPYRSRLDSNVADLRNVAGDPAASTVMAALFLQGFVGDRPWAHLDIAAPSYVDRADGWLTKGATGWGARTLVNLIRQWD